MFTTVDPARVLPQKPADASGRAFVPTERDDGILLDLWRLRLLHTGQLQAVYGPRIFRRLQLLRAHGFVAWPDAQWIWRRRQGGGSRPRVHALAQRGYRRLQALGHVPDDGLDLDFTEKNRELSDESTRFFRHTIGTGDVYVAFRTALARHPALRLVHLDELLPGQREIALPLPDGGWVRPDLVLAVGRGGGDEPGLLFIEKDRSTEPVERFGSPDLQSVKRKYEGYLAYAYAKGHLEQFGIGNFRVLTVTTGGDARVANIARAAGEVTGGVGADRFLVMSAHELWGRGPLAGAWLNAASQRVSLAPGCAPPHAQPALDLSRTASATAR